MEDILKDSTTFARLTDTERNQFYLNMKKDVSKLKKFKIITEDEHKAFLSNIDSEAHIYGKPKLHKQNIPLRPIKSANDGHRLLCEAYGKHALSIKSCEYWFRLFKSGDFDTRDQEREGRPIKFEDAELDALLDEDSSQTQEELAETLGVTQQAISNRLKVMGMVQKQGNWVPYELKPGNIERRICTCELLLKRQNRKGFLHRIVTGDEKWIHYDNPKRRKSSVKPGHASTSTAKPNIHGKKLMLCIWSDQLGVIYYELLQPNETITGERYQQQLMRLSRALKIKRPLYAKRHDKVIYQHDNARPHVAKVVKETLEALQWDVLPHPLYSPDIAPSDYHMFRSMTHGLAEQHFTSYEEAKNWVNVWIASKDEEFFRHGICMLPERWEKVPKINCHHARCSELEDALAEKGALILALRSHVSILDMTPLVVIPGTLTAQRYVDDILRPVLLPFLSHHPGLTFQQDNARPHTARVTIDYLQSCRTLQWPARSPDLSPIEHIWDVMGRRLQPSRNVDYLARQLEKIWQEIPQHTIRNLYQSMTRRVAACIQASGGPTTY
ncbi:SETMAR [Cordylochernes scorpioides]|uniref:SETMAR n=1 Tax=Cordylochernes scorpioides TaxID=51811 RepID=A0ABY6KNJ5_9ARAC|nr:SETMAR [Cordylochernes scorpioides]